MTKTHKNIKVKAEIYASKMHSASNHDYDIHPYRYHLRMVVDFANKYIHLIPKKDRDTVIAGCWVHDTIEDARATYHDVLKNTNKVVAEYAYALTNEKGRNRAERASSSYYYGIRIYKHASFIKLCDRLANVTYSKKKKSGMFKGYKKEYANFKNELYDERWIEIWKDLEELLNNDKTR